MKKFKEADIIFIKDKNYVVLGSATVEKQDYLLLSESNQEKDLQLHLVKVIYEKGKNFTFEPVEKDKGVEIFKTILKQ